jgi:hypothetical protein
LKRLAPLLVVVLASVVIPAGSASASPQERSHLLRVTPQRIALGDVEVGAIVPTVVTVTNKTKRPIVLTTFEVFGIGGNWDLQLPESCGAGTVLDGRAHCSFIIAVAPLAVSQISGEFCVTGVVGSAFQRWCGRIVGSAV